MTLVVPLAIRLKTAKADVHVTKDIRDLTFRSVIPGGFAACQISLDRPLSLDPGEIQPYGDLYVYDGRNGSTIWQGRLEDPGRGAGRRGEVWTVTAVCPAAHARDRTVPLIYVDRDMTRWYRYFESPLSHPDLVERIQEDQGGNGLAALHLQLPRNTEIVANQGGGREYRAIREAGQKLARIGYNWDAGQTNADWFTQLVTRTSGTLAASAAHNTAGGSVGAIVITNFTNGDDLCEIRIFVNVAGTVADDNGWSSITSAHVLAMRFNADGTEKTTGYTATTVLASDVVADLLGRLLNDYDGANASVAATSFAIDQLAYPDGVTPEQVLADLMRFDPGFYWAAWEEMASGKARFEWKAWPSTIRYEASAADGFDSPGSATELYNAVTVRWRDTDGAIKRTRRTQTVQALTDAGLTREAFIDLGDEIGSSANAVRAGDQFLAEHASAPNAGTLTVMTPLWDADRGRMVEPWEIMPGGLIRVRDVLPRVDALNATARDAVTVFRVVATEYNAQSNECRLALDSQPRTIEQFVAAQAGKQETRRR